MISAQRRGCGGGVPTLPGFICWGGTLIPGHNLQPARGHLVSPVLLAKACQALGGCPSLIWARRGRGSPRGEGTGCCSCKRAKAIWGPWGDCSWSQAALSFRSGLVEAKPWLTWAAPWGACNCSWHPLWIVPQPAAWKGLLWGGRCQEVDSARGLVVGLALLGGPGSSGGSWLRLRGTHLLTHLRVGNNDLPVSAHQEHWALLLSPTIILPPPWSCWAGRIQQSLEASLCRSSRPGEASILQCRPAP